MKNTPTERQPGPCVLVAHASAQGSTKEIAERIATTLRDAGLRVDIRGADEPVDLADYDGVVLGSAVHGRALLPAAQHFADQHAETLRARHTWLFSVGIGPSLRGPVGALMRRATPPRIAKVRDKIAARDYRAFAGVMSQVGATPVSRALLRLCGGRYGDLRDWPAIDGWARGIATALRAVTPSSWDKPGDRTVT